MMLINAKCLYQHPLKYMYLVAIACQQINGFRSSLKYVQPFSNEQQQFVTGQSYHVYSKW